LGGSTAFAGCGSRAGSGASEGAGRDGAERGDGLGVIGAWATSGEAKKDRDARASATREPDASRSEGFMAWHLNPRGGKPRPTGECNDKPRSGNRHAGLTDF